MASRADSYPYERGVEDLMATFRAAQRAIAAQVAAAIKSGDLTTAARRRMQLAAVIATLDRLGAETDPIARRLIAEAHQEGADRVVKQILALNITAPETPGAFAGVSTEAVAALQDSMLGRLKTSREIVGRSVDDVYGKAGRREALRSVLGADGSPEAAKRQLVSDLLKDRDIKRSVESGGPGFVDKAGKRWNLDTYAEMVVRTVTREAVVQGAVDRMASHGINLARISTHADSCEICLPYEGHLVSLDGDITEYEGEAVMSDSALPPFHPRCEHSASPVAARIESIKRDLAGQEA